MSVLMGIFFYHFAGSFLRLQPKGCELWGIDLAAPKPDDLVHPVMSFLFLLTILGIGNSAPRTAEKDTNEKQKPAPHANRSVVSLASFAISIHALLYIPMGAIQIFNPEVLPPPLGEKFAQLAASGPFGHICVQGLGICCGATGVASLVAMFQRRPVPMSVLVSNFFWHFACSFMMLQPKGRELWEIDIAAPKPDVFVHPIMAFLFLLPMLGIGNSGPATAEEGPSKNVEEPSKNPASDAQGYIKFRASAPSKNTEAPSKNTEASTCLDESWFPFHPGLASPADKPPTPSCKDTEGSEASTTDSETEVDKKEKTESAVKH